MSVNYEVLQKRLFERIHRTGEEVKNDFPNILRAAIKSKAWKHFTKRDGQEFKNLGEWLTYTFPNGVSMGIGKAALTYKDALQLVADDKELHGLLVKHRPKSVTGAAAHRKNGQVVNNVNDLPRRHMGNSRSYIEQRLQKDFPDIYKEYLDGNIKSARQAGIKAGFIKDSHDPLMRLKTNWKKATPAQKRAFRKWIDEGGK